MLGMQGSTLQTKIVTTGSAIVGSGTMFGSSLEITIKIIGGVLSIILIGYWIRKDIRETKKVERQKERHVLDMEIKEQAFENLKNQNELLKKQLEDN